MLANNRTIWATVIKVAVLIIGLGFVLFSNVGRNRGGSPFNYHFNIDDDNNDNDNDGDIKHSKGISNSYQSLYTPDVKLARLNISGGATSYIISTTTDSLFAATTHETFGDYNLTTTKEDSVTVLNFNMKKHNNRFHWDSDHMNEARISLNKAPTWDINLRGGAAEMKFDLTPYKVRKIDFSGGAASCKLELAANLPLTEVSVSTGASEVEISVPEAAGCKIDVSSGLSSNNFEGFTKMDGTHYTTPGYETAKNKINIRLRGGVSDFNVKRY
jgi:hypothetical protein